MPHDEYIALVDCHPNFQMEVWAFRLGELLMTLCIVLYDIGLDGNIIGNYQLVGPNILPQTKRKKCFTVLSHLPLIIHTQFIQILNQIEFKRHPQGML